MKRQILAGSACAIAIATSATYAHAQQSYSAPIAGIEGAFGGRAGSGTDDSILGVGGGFFGWRWSWFRAGIEARADGSRSLGGFALDAGAFASFDFFTLFLDPELSLGAFFRVDTLVRWVPSAPSSNIGFVPMGSIGLRVVGISFSIAAGPELGLALAPGASAIGFTGEFRVGFDIVELVRLGCHLNQESAKQPP